jgi:hypothetical protein
LDEAEAILDELRQSGKVFAGKRAADYMQVRRQLERKARELFTDKGGKPQLEFPHYMTLGECEWIRSWYEDGRAIRIDTKMEILTLIESLGLPQEWNKNGDKGPERYIEAQIWDDEAVRPFLTDIRG